MSVAIVLAAGAGNRLGGVAKALLCLADGRTFLSAVKETAERGGVTRFVVVVGPPHDEITRREAERLGMLVVANPDPARGMASSVSLGFERAQSQFDLGGPGLLWPVDHPLARADTVRAVAAATGRGEVAIPSFRGRGGHPTGFGRDLWQDLASCVSAPQGARSIIRGLASRHPERVKYLDVSDPGVVADVDTLNDLEQARAG